MDRFSELMSSTGIADRRSREHMPHVLCCLQIAFYACGVCIAREL